MKINAFTIQDLHAAEKGSPFRKDNILDALDLKWQQIQRLADKLDIRAMFNAGDTFHRKSPSQNTHALVQRVMGWFRDLPCPTWAVAGNHDITRDDLSTLFKQPMGTLLRDNTLIRLDSRYNELDHPGQIWYEDDEMVCYVIGYDFARDIDYVRSWLIEMDSAPFEDVRGRKVWVTCVLHLYASPGGPGMVWDEPSLGYDEFTQRRPDVFVLGHDHTAYGTVQLPTGQWVIRPGSPNRGSISREDVQRIPAIGWLSYSPEGIEAKSINLKCSDPEDVFDFVLKQEQRERVVEENAFVEALASAELSDVLSIWDWLAQQEAPDVVKQKVLDLLADQGVQQEAVEVEKG